MKKQFARACARAQMRLWRSVATAMAGSFVRPEGYPHAHAPGPDRARVLLVGSGAALGWGVRCHDLALAGTLARSLAALTGRGVDVDVVADRSLTPGGIVDAAAGAGFRRFDAVVVTVGIQAAMELLPIAAWQREVREMLSGLRELLEPSVSIALLGVTVPRLEGVPSFADRLVRSHARLLDGASASSMSGTAEVFVGAGTGDDALLENAAAGYARLGERVAVALAPVLRDAVRHPEWSDGPLEASRQIAVDHLLQAAQPGGPRVRHLVEMARSALGTESAVFAVLDHGTQRQLAHAGPDIGDVAREHSLCQHTIMESAGMIVEDAREDPRFRDNPLVSGDASGLRFYAGFPIDSPDGYPVGALCVLDSRPRRASDVNAVLLREFALLIQRELWAAGRADAVRV